MTTRPALVAMLGATASGKTAAAVAIARRLPVEVVSADSRQLRRGMRVGTAAPTDEEQADVPHHFVGCVEPDAHWTLADFLEGARAALDGIWSRGRIPLLAGGTGQYVWALLEGWQVPVVPPDPARRAALEREAEQRGLEPLVERLRALDPATAVRVDARNPRRVIRALEIVETTGEPVPPLRREPPEWEWTAFGLRWPRAALHRRADARVERMYASGLMEETRALIERYGPDIEPLRSMGYAEGARVLSGALTVEEAVERTKIETHRLIRMQHAWFRDDDPRIRWLDGADIEGVASAVESVLGASVR